MEKNRGVSLDKNIIIRDETPLDIDAITEVTHAAFQTLPISNHTEEFIIHALRKADVLAVSLVADLGGKVVGHIAFSPVTMADGSPGWYGLGPVSVVPELHRRGIGKALVHQGLSALKALGAKGSVLVGDPDYYERFGFQNLPGLTHEGVPPRNLLALPFDERQPTGAVVFHEGFAAKE
jgi:putative acetyltransferase